MSKRILALAAVATVALAGCQMTQEEQSVATGAAIGAVAGAALAGDNTQGRGAVVGGAIGALAGQAAANR
ncbi:MAG: YMGG-like glycine zipper-containing protein [Pseudomonadota bacterium]